ncbi:hypothetical protein [Moorena sp. SIO3H5]|nr:hypothetical protein [Moorena sp. SIO3H5]NEO74266.1 hypothetical protein [Moorena sp. SIO3H5]
MTRLLNLEATLLERQGSTTLKLPYSNAKGQKPWPKGHATGITKQL